VSLLSKEYMKFERELLDDYIDLIESIESKAHAKKLERQQRRSKQLPCFASNESDDAHNNNSNNNKQ
jgi:hypothetical protein